MPVPSNSTSPDFEQFIAERLKTGRYADRNEVLEVAKAALLQHEADDDLDVEYVRQAIQESEASGIYEGDVFADLRRKFNLPAKH